MKLNHNSCWQLITGGLAVCAAIAAPRLLAILEPAALLAASIAAVG
ncbi:MAG: hypothetical protein M3A44_05095 [Gammaproteobacteria bacterium]